MTQFKQFDFSRLVDKKCAGTFNWRSWPKGPKADCKYAMERMLQEHPGSKVVDDRTHCGWRHDLSGVPWGLYRMITIKTGG